MQAARIAELLQPFLPPENARPKLEPLIQSISTYIDILTRWNTRVNLTAIRDPEQIVTRHFGESLFVARHLFPALTGSSAPSALKRISVADIGSGAGFPGIPMKLWAPQICLTLVESNHKKATFLREIARALTLTDIDIRNTRAESLQPCTFDVVTVRAVERFEQILPTAAALIAPKGRLALLIGAQQATAAARALPGLIWSAPSPTPLSSVRVLLVGQHKSDQVS